MQLKIRCKNILSEIGIPVTVFCRKIGISTASYYRWQNDDLRLAEETEKRIKSFIEKFEG